MTIIDRYVLRLFIKVLVVCLISLTGLFIVVDAMGNLDEFIHYGKLQGGVLRVLADYYSPRVFTFFDRTSGLLALVAAMFAITWMQRTRELTALRAAGIPGARVVRPLVAAAVVVSLLAAANRELMIPRMRARLVRNAQDWLGQSQKPLRPQFDHQTEILINGRYTVAAERKILEPNFRLFTRWGTFGRQLVASQAVYCPPQADRPGGYLLKGVQMPSDVAAHASVYLKGRPIILTPRDTPWLAPDQCFVASGVPFHELAYGAVWQQYASTRELLAGLRNPSLERGPDVRVTVHARLVQPLLDLTLLFLGLPLALTRENRNIFVAAGLALLIVTIFFVIVLGCHALGTSGLVSPAFAAWCPLMMFVPAACVISQPLRRT